MHDLTIEKVIKSNRKTVAFEITDKASVIIRAPYSIDDNTLLKLILRHKKWIEKKINEIKKRDLKTGRKEFVNGESFLYLGKHYKLTITDKQEESLNFDNGFFLHKDYLPIAREIFIKWYKDRAYEKIKERVELYARKRGLKYNRINITDAEKRWGSCSSAGNLNFSWRLIMAPLPVVDYVVVHELVHLIEKNHSKAFWGKVKVFLPDYEKYNEWLKKNGYLLTF